MATWWLCSNATILYLMVIRNIVNFLWNIYAYATKPIQTLLFTHAHNNYIILTTFKVGTYIFLISTYTTLKISFNQ